MSHLFNWIKTFESSYLKKTSKTSLNLVILKQKVMLPKIIKNNNKKKSTFCSPPKEYKADCKHKYGIHINCITNV